MSLSILSSFLSFLPFPLPMCVNLLVVFLSKNTFQVLSILFKSILTHILRSCMVRASFYFALPLSFVTESILQ
jgi:hypothetical protein